MYDSIRMPGLLLIVSLVLAIGSRVAFCQKACECDEFVTPDELEPNFGLVIDRPNTLDPPPPFPNYMTGVFAVSPDGRWLAYQGGWWEELGLALLLKDLQTDTVYSIPGTLDPTPLGRDLSWSPDSRYLYYEDFRPGTTLLELSTLTSRRVTNGYCDTMPFFALSRVWGPDNYWYTNNHLREADGSVPGMYRIPVDSSIKAGCIIYEWVAEWGAEKPFFPPKSVEWYAAAPGTDSIGRRFTGFRIFPELNKPEKRRNIYFSIEDIPGTKPEWGLFSRTLDVGGGSVMRRYSIAVDSCEHIYFHIKVRHQREDNQDRYHPLREDELEARALSGWYRADTNGGNLVRLARSWTNLGISMTADGEKLYYGRISPEDSTSSIWVMDKCGRNKRQVTFPEEDPFTHLLGVDNVRETPRNSEESTLAVWGESRRVSGEYRVLVHYRMSPPGPITAEIYDMFGRLVASRERSVWTPAAEEMTISIPMGNAPSGTYIVVVRSPDSMATTKVIHTR